MSTRLSFSLLTSSAVPPYSAFPGSAHMCACVCLWLRIIVVPGTQYNTCHGCMSVMNAAARLIFSSSKFQQSSLRSCVSCTGWRLQSGLHLNVTFLTLPSCDCTVHAQWRLVAFGHYNCSCLLTYWTVLIIYPIILQTIITAPMASIGGRGDYTGKKVYM